MLESIIWDAETIGFLGTLIFSAWIGWASIIQIVRIWAEQSVASISLLFTWYGFMYFCVRFIYGMEHTYWAVLIHAAVRIVTLSVMLIGIWKFHQHSRRDWVHFGIIISLMPAAMLFPDLEMPFLVLSLVGMGIFFHQPYSIFKRKDAGVVEIRLYIVGFANMIFWLVYCWAIRDWVLLVPTIIALIGNSLTILLIRMYPPQQSKAAH